MNVTSVTLLLLSELISLVIKRCGSNFNQKGNLNAHIKFVHEGLKYKCNQCVLMYCTTDVIAGESKQY